MSTHKKSSAVVKTKEEEASLGPETGQLAEIIPFPDVRRILASKPKEKKRVRLAGKFLYHGGKKIPILQFQKSGYDKLLRLLVKEIS